MIADRYIREQVGNSHEIMTCHIVRAEKQKFEDIHSSYYSHQGYLRMSAQQRYGLRYHDGLSGTAWAANMSFYQQVARCPCCRRPY